MLVSGLTPLRFYRYENFIIKKLNNSKKKSTENSNNQNKNNQNESEELKANIQYLEDFLILKKCTLEKFLQKIDDMIIKTLLSLYPEMLKNCLNTLIYTNNAFQIFEFSFILLEDGQPHFLEIDKFSFGKNFDLKSERIKFLSHIFNLVGIFNKVRDRNLILKSNQFFFDFPNHKLFKQKSFEKNIEIDICSEIYQEYQRKENFALLYPNKNFDKYNFFFENKNKTNKILESL